MSSPVALAWEQIEHVVKEAQRGHLVVCSNKNGGFNRRDVVNNAEVLGPLIQHCGILAY